MTIAKAEPAIDRDWKVAFAAIVMAASGAAIFLLLPIIIGAAVEYLALDEGRASLLASSYFAGYLVICIAAIFFIRRVDWRRLAVTAYCLFIAGLFGLSFTSSFPLLLAAFFVAGIGAGLLFGLAVTLIGESVEKDRYFGLMLMGQQLLAAVMLFVLPDYVVAHWGFSGLAAVLAGAMLLALLTAYWIPSGPPPAHQVATELTVAGRPWLVWLALLAMVVYFVALSGVWTFVERMADARGLNASEIGIGLAIAMVGGMLGGIAVAVLGDRFGRTVPLMLSTLVYGGIFVCYHSDFGFPLFTLASFLFLFFWNYVMGYQLGIVSDLDAEGRYSVLIPAGQALGAVLGAAAAGMAVASMGYVALLVGGAIGIIVALVIFIALPGSNHLVVSTEKVISEG